MYRLRRPGWVEALRIAALVCSVLFSLLAWSSPARATFSLGVRCDLAAGSGTYSTSVADLNGDGKPDLVTANWTANTVSVFLNSGSGGYGVKTDFATGTSPASVAVGDVNGDGRPDLVTANYGANSVSVLIGNGAGGFGLKRDFGVANLPSCVALGDVNCDGALDLVVTNYGSDAVSVLLGTGTGSFGTKTDFATGVAPWSVALGDLNGDGKPDLVTANWTANTVSVLLGTGTGSFGAKTDFAADAGPHSVALGDLNADGRLDLATANYGTTTVSIRLGDGAGGFGGRNDFTAGTQPSSVAMVDVDGDGKADLVSANANSNSVSVLLGNGTGGFGTKTDFTTPSTPMLVAVVDVSGDGRPDIVTANYAASSVSVLLGNSGPLGSGGFGPKADFWTGGASISVAIGDVNGDGKLDLAVANYSSSTVSVLLGNGTGSFGTRTDFATGSGPYSVAIGDVNGDGKPDLAVANRDANTVSVLLGTGTGSFGTKTDFATGSYPLSVAIGDLNGDGRPDLVTANGEDTELKLDFITVSQGGEGEGDFTTGGYVSSVAIGDVNGDGKPDLVTANVSANTLSVLLGTGTGNFGTKTDFAAGGIPCSVAIGDVNGDGRPDLAVANGNFNSVSVLLGFTPTRIALASSPNPSILGVPPTLTATVSVPSPGSGPPTGTVSFFDGTTPLGSTPLAGGTASIGYLGPYPGLRGLSAVYSGDSRFSGSISPTLIHKVLATAAPTIVSIRDLPNDQGGKVNVRWNASALDHVPGNTIDAYWIWRQLPNATALARLAHGERLMAASGEGIEPAAGALRMTSAATSTWYWEYVGSQIAHGYSAYSYPAPTQCDSVGGSNPRTVFMVEAERLSTGEYWSSAPDSGYSVDNLPPNAVAPFTGEYASGTTTLHWAESAASDFAEFKLYRGTSAAFVPGPGNLVATPADTGYVDHAGSLYYYKLSAVDIHGNESVFATLLPSGTVDVPDSGPLAFALEGLQPNPTRGERLSVAFALPTAAPARLELLDVSGRLVAANEVSALGPGRHVVELAAGRSLAPGLYLVRLTQGANTRVRRVVALR